MVVGHSVGEMAAAHVAGALDLRNVAQVVVERSRNQARMADHGGMAAVGLGANDAAGAIAPYGDRLAVSSVNSGQDVTISGDRAALEALGEELRGDVFFLMLDVNYPFHCRAMDPLESPFRAALAGLAWSRPHLPMISTVTGRLLTEDDRLDVSYWWRNVRQPVLFAPAIRELSHLGYDSFLEIGAHPILARYVRRITSEEGNRPANVIPTLSRGCHGPAAMRSAVANVMAAGARVDWDVHFPHRGRVTGLPAYPWQRERHWVGSPQSWTRASRDATADHPLLGARLPSIEPAWSGPLEQASVPWLADHRIGDTVVMPAAAYVEMGLAAGQRVFGSPVEVRGLGIRRALVVPWDDEGAQIDIQVSLSDEDGVLRVASRADASAWQLHARGQVRRLLAEAPAAIDIGRYPGVGSAARRLVPVPRGPSGGR